MENEQKSDVKDDEQSLVNIADVVTTNDVGKSDRCDVLETSKVETEVIEAIAEIEKEAPAAIANQIDENSELKVNKAIDELDNVFLGEDTINDIESDEVQKSNAPSESECETGTRSPLLLIESTPPVELVESTDVSENDVSSSKTGCDGEVPSDDAADYIEGATTDGDIQMVCDFESTPEKSIRYIDSEVSESEVISYNSPPPVNLENVLSKPNEIFELTDDDEDQENAVENSGRRKQSSTFDRSNDYDDEIESDAFENSSDEDAPSMSDEEPMEDDYDSEERIHIEDSDDSETAVPPHTVRRNSISFNKCLHVRFELISNFLLSTANDTTFSIEKIKQRSA